MIHRFLAFIFLLFLVGAAFGQEDSIRQKKKGLFSNPPVFDQKIGARYLKWYLADSRAIITAPLRWKGKDFIKLGGAVVTTILLVKFVDGPAQDYFTRGRSDFWEGVSVTLNPWKAETYIIYGAIAPYIIGAIVKNRKVQRTSLESLEGQLLVSLIAYPINFIANRTRPRDQGVPEDFKPLQGNNGNKFDIDTSFPSGHSILVFAAATAFAEAYKEKKWVGFVTYGLATLVGFERVYRNAHFASDVFVGAFIGHYMTRTILRNHRPHYKENLQNLSFTPYSRFGASGLRLVYQF